MNPLSVDTAVDKRYAPKPKAPPIDASLIIKQDAHSYGTAIPQFDTRNGEADEAMSDSSTFTSDSELDEDGCDPFTRTILLCILFVVGMTVTGCRPVCLRWAKNGHQKFPFMITTWVVMVKLAVVCLSSLMVILTGGQVQKRAEAVATIKLEDRRRARLARAENLPQPPATPLGRTRSVSFVETLVFVGGGGAVPGQAVIPSPRRPFRTKSMPIHGHRGFRNRLYPLKRGGAVEGAISGQQSLGQSLFPATPPPLRRAKTELRSAEDLFQFSIGTPAVDHGLAVGHSRSTRGDEPQTTSRQLSFNPRAKGLPIETIEEDECLDIAEGDRAFFQRVIQAELMAGQIPLIEKVWMSRLLLLPVLSSITSDILVFYMFEYVSPTTYAVVKQVRLLMTAVTYKFVLGRPISNIQWIAMLQLLVASSLFEIRYVGDLAAGEQSDKFSNDLNVIGLSFLLLKVFFDTAATILQDIIFKHLSGKKFPFPQQQLVFAVYSFLIGIMCLPIFSWDDLFVRGRPFFSGYNQGAVISIFLYAFYGILISLLLRFADSMLKMFQALFGVMITILLDHRFFGSSFGIIRKLSFVLVMSSVMVYKLGASRK